MLTFIGILLYILSVMVFSEYAPPQSTNWSIFYFSSIFIGFSLIALDKVINSYDSFTQILLSTCILFFLIMLGQQVLLINKPYDIYMISVNDSFIDTIRFGFFSIIIATISFKYLRQWAKG